MNDLLARAVAAHGGLDRWNKFKKVILVASLTYFAMPILSRLLRQWLYVKSEQSK